MHKNFHVTSDVDYFRLKAQPHFDSAKQEYEVRRILIDYALR